MIARSAQARSYSILTRQGGQIVMRHLMCIALFVVLNSPTAEAKNCNVVIQSDDAMKFDTSEIKIRSDCANVNLTLKHVGKMAAQVMGHNWVLTRTDDVAPVATLGARRSADESYLPPADARILAFTEVIGGGESTTVTFSTANLRRGVDYTFFCSFPGHWSLMRGKLVFG